MIGRITFKKLVGFFRNWWILFCILGGMVLGKGDVVYAKNVENVSLSKLQSKSTLSEVNFPIKRQQQLQRILFESTLPDKVVEVPNAVSMVNHLLLGMRKHQTYFAYYYPGIREDFIEYSKRSAKYDTFMKHLKIRDGYLMGILSGYCISIEGEYVVFQFHYRTSAEEEQWIQHHVRALARSWNGESDARKIKLAHDYLVQRMQYDTRYYSPYDAFYRGRGLCMSYALAFQRLMQELDIPCIYIATNQHAWNMVKLEGYWYNVDVTFDDAEGSYRYFLKSDADFPGHLRPKSGGYEHLTLAKKSYPLEGIH